MNEKIRKYLNTEKPYKKHLWLNAVKGLCKDNLQNDFFLKLPIYFKDYIMTSEKDTKLELAALLFYRYITFLDAVVDGDMQKGQTKNKKIIFQATNSIMLGSIELSECLQNNITLWSSFSERLKFYLNTIISEKKMFKKMSMDIEVAKSIALGKHELLFFYLDCLISDEELNKFKIVKLLSNIIFSIQLLDDINDIDKDFKNNILTYPISELNSFFIKKNIESKTFNLTYLCITEVANKLLIQIIEKLKKSCKVAIDLNLLELHSEIILLKQYSEKKLQSIKNNQ
jgi:hypothetical protein